MTTTNFTNGSTLTDAAWFDDVDAVAYSYLTSVAGTNTITATGPAGMTAYAAGQRFWFIPANTVSGASTINITPSGSSALGAKNIFCGGAACVGGEVRQNIPCVIQYDGTQFNLIGPFVGGFVPGTQHIGGSLGVGLFPTKKLDVQVDSGTGSGGVYLARNSTVNLIAVINGTTGAQFGTETNHGILFLTNNIERMSISNGGSVAVVGALSKGSGSFRIPHPLPSLTDTHQLVHSFIEGPQADLIYRGTVRLVNGSATVNIDAAAGMTVGTFEALCRDVQCFTSNESDWDQVKGSVSGNVLTIRSQNPDSTASISWMVIGERKDKHMMDTDWTDDDGKVIVEPLKPENA